MKTVGAYEAKTKLSALLQEVAAGEHVVITKHGRPVAQLTPLPPGMDAETAGEAWPQDVAAPRSERAQAAVARLEALRETLNWSRIPDGLSPEDLRAEIGRDR